MILLTTYAFMCAVNAIIFCIVLFGSSSLREHLTIRSSIILVAACIIISSVWPIFLLCAIMAGRKRIISDISGFLKGEDK